MPPFPKPRFDYTYDVTREIAALRRYERTKPGRAIPKPTNGNLVLGTWNIANLGVQKRRESDYRLLAAVLGHFDIAAIQEVNDNVCGLREIHSHLPSRYRLLLSDPAGNHERMAFLYDSKRVSLLEKVGEIAISPAESSKIKAPGIREKFNGFDRNPYLGTFKSGSFSFLLANVHLFFGSDKPKHMRRRALETYTVARWAHLRRKSPYAYAKDVIVLGDFNMPAVSSTDPVYRALTRYGLKLPPHSTQIGSAIASDSHYDQVAFFPGETEAEFTGRAGVFDFDGAVFADLWRERTPEDFRRYVRYYLSDHRPLWAEFQT